MTENDIGFQALSEIYRFGLEIEFTGITKAKAASILKKVLGSEKYDRYFDEHNIIDITGRTWRITTDTTISKENKFGKNIENMDYSVELTTPILKIQDIGTLKRIINALKHHGARVNETCGIHVHTDFEIHTPQSIKKLLSEFYYNQNLIYDMLEIYKNREREYCPKISGDAFEKLQNKNTRTIEDICSILDDKFTAINILNISKDSPKKTIEFRIFNSSLDVDEIVAYVEITLAMSHKAINGKCVKADIDKLDVKNNTKRGLFGFNHLIKKRIGESLAFSSDNPEDLKEAISWLVSLGLSSKTINILTKNMRERSRVEKREDLISLF